MKDAMKGGCLEEGDDLSVINKGIQIEKVKLWEEPKARDCHSWRICFQDGSLITHLAQWRA